MKIATALSVVALFTLTATSATRAEAPEVEAKPAALAWLRLLDARNYAQTWNEASAVFRERMSQSQWTFTVKRRTLLGVLRWRKLQSAAFESTLRGAPDGQYVILRFLSDFVSEFDRVIETVVMKKDADGTWRVADFYLGSGAGAGCVTGSRTNCK